MEAQPPSLSTRARWIFRTQLAAVRPGRKHTPGIHTRTTGFIPFTSPARDAVAVAFREARRDGYRHWGPGHLLLGLTAQDQGLAARALGRLGSARSRYVSKPGRSPPGRAAGRARAAAPPPGDLIQAVLAEAAAHCDYRIGTDHLLLALFRADDQTAARH